MPMIYRALSYLYSRLKKASKTTFPWFYKPSKIKGLMASKFWNSEKIVKISEMLDFPIFRNSKN